MAKFKMQVMIDPKVHRELKVESAVRNIPMSKVLEVLAREWAKGEIDVPELKGDQPVEEE